MRVWLALGLLAPLVALAQVLGLDSQRGQARRGEISAPLPQFPKAESYLPFQVSPTTPFAFYVDAKSVSVGADRVFRYTLIAKSSAGALNISFEGMRCIEREFRVFAYGRSDGTWSEVRQPRWEPIRVDARNGERAVLYSDYFCPVSRNIANAEEAVEVLKRGGNSEALPRGD